MQGDIIVGVVGGLVGGLLFPQLGFLLGGGSSATSSTPVIGAVDGDFRQPATQEIVAEQRSGASLSLHNLLRP